MQPHVSKSCSFSVLLTPLKLVSESKICELQGIRSFVKIRKQALLHGRVDSVEGSKAE